MFDTAIAQVPPEHVALSSCQPSGWLALEVDTALSDPTIHDDADLIEAAVAFDRLVSWAQARQARVLAEFARRRSPDTGPAARRARVAPSCGEFATDEVALALRLSRMAAGARLHTAVRLDDDLPETLTAWEHGRIDNAKARAIVDACRHLPVELARAVQQRVLPRAPEQTQGQLRAALARAVIAVDPDGVAKRHEGARADRRVVLNPEPDGMAGLWALLPAPDAVAAYENLGRLALELGASDPRGMDARRADLLTDLITGRRCASAGRGCCHGGRHRAGAAKATVHVTVPITTLMGLDDNPAELRGYGPIPAALALEIAAGGTWRRLLTDPESGALLDYGRTTYTPPVGLADFVRARDVHCRSPICRRSSNQTDLDHTVAWADGGTTSADNLYAGCRHDHRLKTHAVGWRVVQSPNGTVTYTTPTGHRYESQPHDYRIEPQGPPSVSVDRSGPPVAADPDPPPF